MVKKGKGGKMMKRKKSKSVPVHAYDLDSIKLNDLKMYITKLRKEIVLIRKDRDFYTVNKGKIMDFLQTMKAVYVSQRQTSVVQNSHIDDHIGQLRQFSEMHNEKAIISDKEKTRKKLEKMFSDFVERNTAIAEHLDEEYDLKQKISDMDRCLQRSRYLYETMLMDNKELFRMAQEEKDNKYSQFLESSLKQYVNESLKSYQDFNADKIKTLFSVWNTKEQPFKMGESFINEMKDMQNFFYEISLNNREVAKMLKEKLECLSLEERKVKFNLKETLLENAKLKAEQESGFYHQNSLKTPAQTPGSMKNIQNKKMFQKLEFTNAVLQEELRNVKANWENLKGDFLKATRMIYQKADFKAFVLEEFIKKKLMTESIESEDEELEPIFMQTNAEKKADDSEDDAINVFSMRVENSDTLYVPPVYHKSWNRNFKEQFRGKKVAQLKTIHK